MKRVKMNLQLFAATNLSKEKAAAKEALLGEDGTGSVDMNATVQPTLSEREAELQAQIDAIKKQAAEEKAMYDNKIKELTKASEEGEAKELSPEEYLEETVQIQLIKDNDKYKDDVTLSINGINILVKRGVPVAIKRKHALVLESAYRQQMIAADLMTTYADEYKERASRLS